MSRQYADTGISLYGTTVGLSLFSRSRYFLVERSKQVGDGGGKTHLGRLVEVVPELLSFIDCRLVPIEMDNDR